MDKVFVIGHRGVGKTSLIKGFSGNDTDYKVFDLDEEIERSSGQTIIDYFKKNEQEQFRQTELKTLSDICQKNSKFIVSLGAGFKLKDFKFPENSLVLWVRRQTDEAGRVFIDDRPALTTHKDPLKEWQEIFDIRQNLYAEVSNAQVFIPEALDAEGNYLFEYLMGDLSAPQNYYCTLKIKENDWVALGESFGLELRNDLMSELNIHNFLKQIRKDRKLILAIRKVSDLTANFLQNLDRVKLPNLKIDWDINLGAPADFKIELRPGDILSEHRGQYDELLKTKKTLGEHYIYKFAPEVSDLKSALDLIDGVYSNFKNMAYLPRSESIDLSWLRNCLAKRNAIHFFRFAEGSAKEQSFWYDLKHHKKANHFYGILGENVTHSLTPEFHKNFFLEKRALPLRISITPEQFKPEMLEGLKKLGIKYLAVTAPYKNKVYNHLKPDIKVARFESVNTCFFKKESIVSCDTDYPGLKTFFETHLDQNQKTIVWGGGSLLSMLKDLLPQAIFVAARTGEARDDNNLLALQSDLNQAQLIWAGGEQGLWPEFKDLIISKVIDLDYKNNSKAKAWAYMNQIPYVSGTDFFINQALKQQEFWNKYDV